MEDANKYIDEEIAKLNYYFEVEYPEKLNKLRVDNQTAKYDILKNENVGMHAGLAKEQAEKELSFEYDTRMDRLKNLENIKRNLWKKQQGQANRNYFKGPPEGYRR